MALRPALAFALGCALCACAARAAAQAPPGCKGGRAPGTASAATAGQPRPGFHRHDGFMARLAVGFGTGRATADGRDAAGPLDREQTGFAGTLSLDIGGSPVENVIIHARLAEHTIVSPRLELNGEDYGRVRGATAGVNLVGAGVTYYLTPLDLYGTAVVGVAGLVFTDRYGGTLHSRAGIGLNADVGKEWWISADVGIGVGARLWYTHSVQENGRLELRADEDYLGWAVIGSFTWQ